MKPFNRIIFSSVLAVSPVVPQFAHAAYLENPTQISTMGTPVQHVVSKRVRAHRAIDVNAYAWTGAPASAPASVDFGIGSQR